MHGVQLEYKHILNLKRKISKSSTSPEDLWFTASHAEHSRPMFEIVGPYIHKALAVAIEAIYDKESAQRTINYILKAIHLSSLLGLDNLCQQFVATLAKATAVHSLEALSNSSFKL